MKIRQPTPRFLIYTPSDINDALVMEAGEEKARLHHKALKRHDRHAPKNAAGLATLAMADCPDETCKAFLWLFDEDTDEPAA